MGSRWMRNSFVYLMILVAVIAIVVVFFRPSSDSTSSAPLSQVIADAKGDRIDKIEVEGDKLKVKIAGGDEYTSRKEPGSSIVTILSENGVQAENVNIDIKEESKLGDWLGLLLNFLPIPPFDGGLVVLMIIEKIRGTALSERAQGVVAYAGWAMILALLVYVTFNDIVRTFFS
jgi:ATP-dependent Zn protease